MEGSVALNILVCTHSSFRPFLVGSTVSLNQIRGDENSSLH